MRVRDEHRTALDDAAAIGVRFRERLAATLRQVEGSEKVPAGKVKPLALDRDDLIELRATEARLTILFGAEHEATASFQAFHDAVKEGVEVVRNAGTAPIGGPTSTETGAKRRAARQALDRYLEAAGRTLKSHVD
jgi:hypothetical protein